jgi:hypothetical protein
MNSARVTAQKYGRHAQRSTRKREIIMDERIFNKLASYAAITAVAEDADLLGQEVTSAKEVILEDQEL